jgi:asparaginyl-tRNA synthetase
MVVVYIMHAKCLHPWTAHANAEGIDHGQDFFGRPTFLTVSGQLNAESYALALDRVYTLGPTFRAENSNTRRHLAEFWMIEPEMAFADLDDNADLAEEYVQYLVTYVLDHCGDDLAFFDQWVEEALDRLTFVADSEFERTRPDSVHRPRGRATRRDP